MIQQQTRPPRPKAKLGELLANLRQTWQFILEHDRRQHQAFVAFARTVWSGLTGK